MARSQDPYTRMLRELAAIMLSVAGESVSMMKRSAPEQALKLKPQDEWSIYIEFLKLLFNLADRFSILRIPLKDQPQFMDSLEDAVADQLKATMAPLLSSDADPMEIVLTVGNAVAESRQLYEPFRFVVTEESKEKEACFGLLADRVAEAMDTRGAGMVTSAATLCMSAFIPAMTSLFESLGGASPGEQETIPEANLRAESAAEPKTVGKEIKLVSVMSSIRGEEVETRWGLHPQFRRDLSAHERKEVTRLMNRVTQILGERYAAVAFSETWASWHHPGNA